MRSVMTSESPTNRSTLIATSVITPTIWLALGLAAALLLVDGLGWYAAAAVFDRERLITGGSHRPAT
jgi:hypothetical protein